MFRGAATFVTVICIASAAEGAPLEFAGITKETAAAENPNIRCEADARIIRGIRRCTYTPTTFGGLPIENASVDVNAESGKIAQISIHSDARFDSLILMKLKEKYGRNYRDMSDETTDRNTGVRYNSLSLTWDFDDGEIYVGSTLTTMITFITFDSNRPPRQPIPKSDF